MDFLSRNKNLTISIIFTLFFLIGLITFRDYGIGIDDKFHRLNGFFWLSYLLEIINFTEYLEITNLKLENITDYTLPSVKQFSFYIIRCSCRNFRLFEFNDLQEYYFFAFFKFFLFF